jgi:RimJ/RimL family protein N-acetyltransferase/predicted enzyme related to lactoylglutathione lyase
MDTPQLATPRLQLTPLTLSDADDLFEAFRDPEVVRYWHEPAHASVEVTRAALAQGLSGGGHWWAIRKPGGPALGMLNYLSDEDATGMGYLLRRDQWRQGLASEAVRAALEWGFETRGLERVELWINSGNLASRALATRLGFLGRGRFRQVQEHRPEGEETLVLGMTVSEWSGVSSAIPAVRTYGIEPTLYVRDAGVSMAFYRDVLGFQVGFSMGDPVRFAMIHRGEWFTEGARFRLATSATPGRSEILLNVGPGIDELHAEVVRRGGSIAEPLVTQPWGFREFGVSDPDRNVIMFGTAVPEPGDEQ